MAEKDWKDLLNNLISKTEDTAPEINPEQANTPAEKKQLSNRQDLIIRFERRNGKPATIISNFKGSDNELKELASRLKTHCGAGGSAKDDEILIQGDTRKKVAAFLRDIGHNVRGDIR